jgi:hypothetical protein
MRTQWLAASVLWSGMRDGSMGCLQKRSLDLDERIDAEQVCLS